MQVDNNSSGTATSEASNLADKVSEAHNIQQQAHKRIEATQKLISDIKHLPEKSDVKNTKAQIATQELNMAKIELKIANDKKMESEDKLKKSKLKRIHDIGPTIAGYKPMELIKAFVKPPEPYQPESDQPVPNDMERQIKFTTEKIGVNINTAKDQIKKLEKEISTL